MVTSGSQKEPKEAKKGTEGGYTSLCYTHYIFLCVVYECLVNVHIHVWVSFSVSYFCSFLVMSNFITGTTVQYNTCLGFTCK